MGRSLFKRGHVMKQLNLRPQAVLILTPDQPDDLLFIVFSGAL